VLAGARDLDPPETEYLARAVIRTAGLDEVTTVLPAGPLHVHADLDIIDPGWLPGLRYPAPGGASPGAVSDVLRGLLSTGRAAALDIACTWHPGHGAAAVVGPYLEAALAS
jgi:arginase